MQEIRDDLDKILNLIAEKIPFEDYDKIFNLYLKINQNLNLIEEWYCEKD